jgi:hypothetical protein
MLLPLETIQVILPRIISSLHQFSL